jgi:hypothetical protein
VGLKSAFMTIPFIRRHAPPPGLRKAPPDDRLQRGIQ